MNANNVNDILALAGVLATKRVRRFAVSKGLAGPRETIDGAVAGAQRAYHELECYLSALAYGAYFILDDVIDERGREGYEVMHGNPFDATGFSQFKSLRYGDCLDYVKKRTKPNEPVYRVKLARRHKVPSVKLINMEKA